MKHLLYLNKNLFYKSSLFYISLICAPATYSDEYFDINALTFDSPNSISIEDLNYFKNSHTLPPGKYRVSIYINGEYLTNENIEFIELDKKLLPLLSLASYKKMGLLTESLESLKNKPNDYIVKNMLQDIPGSSERFDSKKLRLDISIPQVLIKYIPRQQIDIEHWDDGIPALVLNYNLSGANTWLKKERNKRIDNYFLNLQSGFNYNAWRIRNYSTYTDNNKKSEIKSINTYIERDLKSIKSRLTLGESATSPTIFDSFQFSGVQLASDENMLPESLRGFAPIVRGIANSNSQVTIKQNNNIIYQTYVSPGAFEISDLYPTAYSGNLTVTIKGADGSERTFEQPFASVPIMQREGQMKYEVVTGKYRSSQSKTGSYFGQSTLSYGFPYGMTLYGGGLAANNYYTLAIGSGVNLFSYGAASFDITHSSTQLTKNNSDLSNKKLSGQSFRLQYAKGIIETGTTLNVAAYRYSTRNYYNFSEFNDLNSNNSENQKKQKLQLTVNQTLFDWGSLYISAYQQDYWNIEGYERSINAGYSNFYRGIGYNLNYNYIENSGYNDKKDNQIAFSVQIPLYTNKNNRMWLALSTNHNDHGSNSQNISINGNAFEDNSLNYSISKTYGNNGQKDSGSLNISMKNRFSELGTGYNYSNNTQQLNYNMRGGIIAHSDGITFGQSLGDTIGLIKVGNAKNINILNTSGIKTDNNGYAIVPYLSSYQENRIVLDIQSFGPKIEVEKPVLYSVPTKGAITLTKFNATIGNRALFNITHQNEKISFGATVIISSNENNFTAQGMVNDDSTVYFSGIPPSGMISVILAGEKHCLSPYHLLVNKTDNDNKIFIENLNCVIK